MPSAIQDCLSPMLDSFPLYHHSFNFKELAPDLQQRKTGFSVLEKKKKKTLQFNYLFKSSSSKVPIQNHSKMPQFILKIA